MRKPGFGGRFPIVRRILCLYLPQWPIQRLLGERERRVGPASGARADPPISSVKKVGPSAEDHRLAVVPSAWSHPTPVLLHARDPRRGDLTVTCNEAAAARGVRVGMPLAEAEALAGHGGGECRIEPHDAVADLAALARLAEHCERFSPIVGWRTVEGSKFGHLRSRSIQSSKSDDDASTGNSIGPDGLFLDVTGIGILFGGEEHLSRAVVNDMAEQGYECLVAIGDTIGMTWAAT